LEVNFGSHCLATIKWDVIDGRSLVKKHQKMLASWASIISEIPLKLRKRFEELVKNIKK
jgi:hypothetical protein